MSKRLSYNEVSEFFKVNNCMLLSPEYKNNSSILDFNCSCGNRDKVTLSKFKQGQRCKECGMNKKKSKLSLDYSEVKTFFEVNNCILLSKEYTNAHDHLQYICVCGEENSISYANFYSGRRCNKCSVKRQSTKIRRSLEEVKNIFIMRNCTLLSTKYKNNKQILDYICKCGRTSKIRLDNFLNGNECAECGDKKVTGENHPNWQGGLTLIKNYLRYSIKTWKKESMFTCSYKCVITGDKFDDIHHLYSYSSIFKELLSETDFEVKDNFVDHSKDEIEYLENKIVELHYKYGFGVCLRRDIHTLFHTLYGRGNNTPEQFDEFVMRYNIGEFNISA